MIDFDPYCDAFLDDPYPCYQRLREEDPLHRFVDRENESQEGDAGAWFLSRFEDVWTATRNGHLSVAGGITPSQLLLGAEANPMMPSQMDPPRHTQMRSLLSRHFRPATIAVWESEIRKIAKSAIAEALQRGRLDVAQDLGARISCHMACRVVGLTTEYAGALPDRINAFFHRRPGHRGETEKAAEAAAELFAWAGQCVADVRTDPRRASGILSALLEARIEERPLTDEEIVYAVVNLLIAAADTFPKALAGTLDRLERAPDSRTRVVRDRSLVLPAFNETLRIDTPTQFQGRTVLDPFEMHGMRIERGARVCFLFASANRDPREFANPDRFDLDRKAPRTLAFGYGVHMCLGKRLALLEARVALEEFLTAIPEYAVMREEAQFARTEYVRGWLRLPVEFPARSK